MANSVWVNTFGGMSFNGSATTFGFPVLLPDGSAGTPAVAFASQTTMGLYRIGASTVGLTPNGTLQNEWGAGYYALRSDAAIIGLGASFDTQITRDAANTLALRNGTAAQRFNVGPTGNLLSLIGSAAGAASYIEGIEGTAPAAGAADTFRLFAQDNGGGKTQLMVIFNSGAAQQIALQP